ncbi:4-sulfomuconolactone hydrolase [Rubripirellula lacrimiformis]|uniref:4-sulfomuconolactone hydrolase n=1 Tax=Rubripirellula lacrimiformis TaxID=1930273 RepID=A0A517NL11_9BACT|nr:amidohydrolase family protein [Rubripirellula lacrimiformis]QDT07828.1 4-sulfomuconolactone hydrolase [Rubripirellula lacrimiformis]
MSVLDGVTPTRRQALKVAGSAMVGAAIAGSRSSAWADAADASGQRRDNLLIDTHLHCFAGPRSVSFPYHANAPYRPTAAATPEYLIECMDAVGVDFAVVVHPEPYQDDHRYLEHCLKVGSGRLKGTVLVFSDRPDASRQVQELHDRTDVVAVRVHAYAPERMPDFDSDGLRRLWSTATRLGLAVQLHFEPRHAAKFASLIRDFPDTTVLIDHLGRPFQGTSSQYDDVLALADFPNTIMKLSSIPVQTNYPHRDIRPTIDQIVDRFGPSRLMYGGGFNASATPASYRQTIDRARSLLGALSDDERQMVFGGTAKRALGF